MLDIRNESGSPIGAAIEAATEERRGLPAVVLQSAGDSRRGQSTRNPDYDEGLGLLLQRLAALDLKLADAQVASAPARRLPHAERQVRLPDRAYPIAIDDPDELRSALKAAMARTARRPGAKGAGNAQKALLLAIESTLAPRALAELLASPLDLTQPTADEEELDRRVRALRKTAPTSPPEGQRRPRQVERTVMAVERSPAVKRFVLDLARGRCEACDVDAPFSNDQGEAYLEVHHVVTLAAGGPDTPDNAVALCPTCHRALHYADDRRQRRERLWETLSRLVRPPASF